MIIRPLSYVCLACQTRVPVRQTVSTPDGSRRIGPWCGTPECETALLARLADTRATYADELRQQFSGNGTFTRAF